MPDSYLTPPKTRSTNDAPPTPQRVRGNERNSYSTPPRAQSPELSPIVDRTCYSTPPHRAASPASPSMVTPPRPNTQVFGFFAAQGKVLGFTPGRKNLVTLAAYEGKSHLRVRENISPKVIYSSDVGLTKEQDQYDQAKYLQLYAQLKALKNRTDTDYQMRKRNGSIDGAHYHTAIYKSQSAIRTLKNYIYTYDGDVVACLNGFNAAINGSTIYNPFGLQQIYGAQENEYKENLTSHLGALTPKQLGLELSLKPLIALAAQADKDYYVFTTYGVRAEHYAATKCAIEKTIKMLKINANDMNIELFLAGVNKKLLTKEIYNPFDLLRLYEGPKYDAKLAVKADKLRTPLAKADLMEIFSIELNGSPLIVSST
ncbi:MAG: hypothetical protein PSV35_04455 [bacterium]|nr:hypothetical protein [bacterium]